MKKILLTLFVGFCFGNLVYAQESAKVVKKKKVIQRTFGTADKTTNPYNTPEYLEKVKIKKEKAAAIEAGKLTPAVTSQGSREKLKADKKDN
ncbi:MAG TPA: hypothetical protein PK872_02185 [Ferruginibacter sp.]|jgi:hypothetical protein|nr:hypothetical protein [Ferruginibacter sp.]